MPLNDLLTALGDAPPDRVYLVPHGGVIPSAAAMAAAPTPDGWTAMRHHLDDRTPVWRYERHDGRRLVVYSAATWWGREAATSDESAAAWRRLGLIVADTWKDGQLLSTPGATGLDLLRRSLPAGERYAARLARYRRIGLPG